MCLDWLVRILDSMNSVPLAYLDYRFPFLFFGTTWMGVVMAEEQNRDPEKDEATQAGDRAMLIYSVGESLLPKVASNRTQLNFVPFSCCGRGHSSSLPRLSRSSSSAS